MGHILRFLLSLSVAQSDNDCYLCVTDDVKYSLCNIIARMGYFSLQVEGGTRRDKRLDFVEIMCTLYDCTYFYIWSYFQGVFEVDCGANTDLNQELFLRSS